jgi:SRP-independent targeting protein 2/TMEM208
MHCNSRHICSTTKCDCTTAYEHVVAAVPTYSPSGDLVSGGGDLGLGGITAYYFDAIYLAVFVQITTVLSSKFWLVFLVVSSLCGYDGITSQFITAFARRMRYYIEQLVT